MDINPASVCNVLTEPVLKEFPNAGNSIPTDAEKLVADDLLKKLKDFMLDYAIEEDYELIQDLNQASESSSWSQGSYVDDDGHEILDDSTDTNQPGYVSLQRKEEILKLVAQHPNWKLPTIQTHGGKELKHKSYKALWKQQILEGGTKIDKFNFIDNFVITKFDEARKEYKCVKEIHLRQWAIQASQTFRDSSFVFKASRHWATNFKNRHGIVSRKVTKLVSRRKLQSIETLLDSAKRFQENIKSISNSYKPELILNTDQVGFAYELTENRTLSYKGEKETLATAKSPRNLVTHSYTAQYTINMDGKIVGDVFLCLQEASGRLGPIVEETLIPVPNVTLTCSTSGKMTRSLCEYYLDKIIVKNVHEDFVLILDSYGGHTNACSYSDRFGINGTPNCILKIIPENCTDICQPLDTTFHRQLKYFARAISTEFALNYSSNVNPVDEVTSRNNIIRMQSLLHNQLSAPVFQDMIKYSWFSSGLTDDRPIFLSVSEVCFSFHADDSKTCKNCNAARFVKCAHCAKVLCFKCFFYDYHFHFEIIK